MCLRGCRTRAGGGMCVLWEGAAQRCCCAAPILVGSDVLVPLPLLGMQCCMPCRCNSPCCRCFAAAQHTPEQCHSMLLRSMMRGTPADAVTHSGCCAATLQAPHESYSVFMLLGNDKLPIVVGLGHVNFYMCQVCARSLCSCPSGCNVREWDGRGGAVAAFTNACAAASTNRSMLGTHAWPCRWRAAQQWLHAS